MMFGARTVANMEAAGSLEMSVSLSGCTASYRRRQ